MATVNRAVRTELAGALGELELQTERWVSRTTVRLYNPKNPNGHSGPPLLTLLQATVGMKCRGSWA